MNLLNFGIMAKIISDPIESYRGRIGKISYYICESENMARKSSSNGKVSDAPAAVAQRKKFKRLIELTQGLAPVIQLGFPQRLSLIHIWFFSGLFHIFNQPFTISGYSSYHSAWQ